MYLLEKYDFVPARTQGSSRSRNLRTHCAAHDGSIFHLHLLFVQIHFKTIDSFKTCQRTQFVASLEAGARVVFARGFWPLPPFGGTLRERPPQKNYAKINHSQYVLFAGLSVECVLCNSSRCWYCFQWVQDGLMYSCGTITHLCLRPGKTLDWALKRGEILRAYHFYGKIRHFLVSPLVAVELVSLRS